MKRMPARISWLFLASLVGWLPVQTQAAPTSEAQLLQTLETALKAKDKDAIMALYNWEEVPAWVKAGQGDDIDDWLTRELKIAKLSPLPPGFSSAGEHGNVRFHLNVKPAGIVELGFTDAFGVGFPVL